MFEGGFFGTDAALVAWQQLEQPQQDLSQI